MKMMAVSNDIYKALKKAQLKEVEDNNRWLPITRMKNVEVIIKPKKCKDDFFKY